MTMLPRTFCLAQPSVQFSAANGNNLRMIDYDAPSDSSNIVGIRLIAYIVTPNGRQSAGTLQLAGSLLGTTGNGTLNSPLELFNSLSAVNAALAQGLIFTPTANLFDTVTIEAFTFEYNFDVGGLIVSSTNSFSFQVGCTLNNPPVNILPPDFEVSASNFVNTIAFSRANSRGLAVTDPDAAAAPNFLVQLSSSVGRLRLVPPDGNAVGSGTPSDPLRITSFLSFVNVFLGDLVLDLPEGFVGDVLLTMTSNDRGATGLGGAKTDTDVLTIRVNDSNPNNDPPVNHVPDSFVTGLPFVTVTPSPGKPFVTDIDAGEATNFSVKLSATDARLVLTNANGITASGRGTTTDPLLLLGSLSNINAALRTGLTIYPTYPNILGTKTITITSDDKGNTGLGGAQQDTDSWTIRFEDTNPPNNNPPTNFLPANFSTSVSPIILSQTNGNNLFVFDTDAGNANDFLVSLSVPAGNLVLVDGTGLRTVVGDGTTGEPLLLQGTLESINTALARGLRIAGLAPGL